MEMNEDYYISRNALLKHFEEHFEAHQVGEIERDIWFAAYEDVDNFDLADVAPVVHARWIGNCMCSVCHGSSNGWAVQQGYDFCPHCGAKMDGE